MRRQGAIRRSGDDGRDPPDGANRTAREERLHHSWRSSWIKNVALESSRREGSGPGKGGLRRPPAREGGSRPPSRNPRLLPRSRTALRSRGRGLTISGLLIAVGLSLLPAAGAAGLEAKPSRSTDGVYQLSWESKGKVLLEEARDPGFTDSRIVYRGRDQATTLTGRRDGVYYYRLSPDSSTPPGRATAGGRDRDVDVDRSAVPLQVRVEHHSLLRALSVFAVGLGVFGATVWLVLAGPQEGVPGEASQETRMKTEGGGRG